MRPVPGTVSPSQEPCGPADACSQDADDSVLKLPRALGVAILCVHRGGDRGSEVIWPCSAVVTEFKPSPRLLPSALFFLPLCVYVHTGGGWGRGQGRGGLEDRRPCFLHTEGPSQPQPVLTHRPCPAHPSLEARRPGDSMGPKASISLSGS